MFSISNDSGEEEEVMGEAKFRGDTGRLVSMVEDMAHCVYGLAKDEKSKAAAEAVASRLLTLSGVKFEKEEEPIRPRISRRVGGGNV